MISTRCLSFTLAAFMLLTATVGFGATPTRTVIVSTVDWQGNPLANVQVCLGNGLLGEEALFGIDSSDQNGQVRFQGVPGGSSRRSWIIANGAKMCAFDAQPVDYLDDIGIYECGVGAEHFYPRRTRSDQPIEIELRIGLTRQKSDLAEVGDTMPLSPESCGQVVISPYPSAMELSPKHVHVNVRSSEIVKVKFNSARSTESLYHYRWEINDPTVVAIKAGTSTNTSYVSLVGLNPGSTEIVAYRQNLSGIDGSTEVATSSATVTVGSANEPEQLLGLSEPYQFGWDTPVSSRAVVDFMLPHTCAEGRELGLLIHSRGINNTGCSLRNNEQEGCATCHTPETSLVNMHDISKSDFCELVPYFVISAIKPQYLKNFFNDWYTRGCPE